jgi:hypothetical protein
VLPVRIELTSTVPETVTLSVELWERTDTLFYSILVNLCFLMKARPEPDLRYFSKSNAVYLLEKEK